MACLLLSFCNPLWLTLIFLLSALSIVLPKTPSSILVVSIALAPIFALFLMTRWVMSISLFNNCGAVFKSALLMLGILYLLNDDGYFHMIAIAQKSQISGDGIELAILQVLNSILSLSSLMTLVFVLLIIVAESSIRLFAGQYSSEIDPMLEVLRSLLIIAAATLAIRPLLELLTKVF